MSHPTSTTTSSTRIAPGGFECMPKSELPWIGFLGFLAVGDGLHCRVFCWFSSAVLSPLQSSRRVQLTMRKVVNLGSSRLRRVLQYRKYWSRTMSLIPGRPAADRQPDGQSHSYQPPGPSTCLGVLFGSSRATPRFRARLSGLGFRTSGSAGCT